jgi:hypothetical protein
VLKRIEIAAAAALVVTAGAVWLAWPSKGGAEELRRGSTDPAALATEGSGVALQHTSGATEATLENAAGGADARASGQQRRPADASEVAAASAGVRVFGHVRDARGEPINKSGGTFTLHMGGRGQLQDLPIVSFDALRADHVGVTRVEDSGTPAREPSGNDPVEPSAGTQIDLGSSPITLELDLGGAADQDALNAAFSKAFSRLILRGSTSIVFADSEGCRSSAGTGMESEYSAEGLHAGKWHAIVTHDGKLCRRQDFEIEPGERQHQLDLVLDDALAVRIRLRTPDGRELNDAVAADPDLGSRAALSPVALRPGSAARYLPGAQNDAFGCGRYERRQALGEERRKAIGDAAGVLTITEAPPLDVGLVLNGTLIARRPLAPGQEEVEFVLSLEELRRWFTTLVVRVADAGTHAPVARASVTVEGASTRVESSPSPEAADGARIEPNGTPTDAQGTARIPWAPSGLRLVRVSAKGYASFSGRFEVDSSGTCELPPIELTGAARISGHVFDAAGKPVQAMVQLLSLERFEQTREDPADPCVSSENGAFGFAGLRRERHVLRVETGEQLLAALVVDTTQGDVGDLELHLVASAEVELRFTREPKEGAELRVTTAAGLPALERDLAGLAPLSLPLAPGAYTAEVREGAHKAGSVRFVVAKDALRVVLPLD